MAVGYVYALINPSMPGLVKVGRTERDPENRIGELSAATGVATPFILAFKEYFSDCESAETHIHTMLEIGGARLSANREFFQASLNDVVSVILSAPGRISQTDANASSQDLELITPDEEGSALAELSLRVEPKPSIAEDLYEQGDYHYYGVGDYLQDYTEAISLYTKSAKLGFSDAFLRIGSMYSAGEGVTEDKARALQYFKEAVKRGNPFGYLYMGEIFLDERNDQNANKCYELFFRELRKNPLASTTIDETYKLVFTKFYFMIILYKYLFARTKDAGAPFVFDESMWTQYYDVLRPMKSLLLQECDDLMEWQEKSGAKDSETYQRVREVISRIS